MTIHSICVNIYVTDVKDRGNAMGKYTNEEDRRQTVSLIVRTLLGIAVTFGLPWLNPLLAFLFYIGRGG